MSPTAVGGRRTRDQVVLVDEHDRPIGVEAKLAAHESGGQLHRAFSVFVFDPAGRMLLQRRAASKYHFGGLWTNACCSHPQWDEDVRAGATERLDEEFGIRAELTHVFTFRYRATDASTGLTEHEIDHVFFARFESQPNPNGQEISEWKWMEIEDLQADIAGRPERYTPWFKISLDEVIRRQSADRALGR